MKFRLFFAVLISLICLTSHAQISFGGLPTTMQSSSLRHADLIPCITVNPDTTTEIESNQFAYPNDVDIDIIKEATSRIVDDKIIYRLLINSQNAKSINLIFNNIHLPNKAKMFLSRPDCGEIYGAYTNESFVGDVFATTPVSGDSILIQCEIPAASADSFSATISAVNTGFDALRLLPSIGKSQMCETNAICQINGLEDQSRSTCLIIINGIRYCSGSLIATNGNNSKSFVLTSAHCMRNSSYTFDSTLAKKCVFYFGYNTPICESQIVGSYEKSISGSQVASAHPGKDMALLQLSHRPPVDYMTYESGWNIASEPQGPVSCLHYPNGNIMKISISDDNPSPISFPVEGLEEDSHWLIKNWHVGITEDGSSGSPLYDAEGLIIGALSGGTSFCSQRGNDKFWRLNSVWDNSLSTPTSLMSVIDSSLSGRIKTKGKESYEKRCYQLKNYDSFSELDELYKNGYGYASGTNKLGLEEFAEKFTSEYSATEIHGVSFIPILGQFSSKKPVYLRIYTGEETPDSLVYESVVKITAKEYQSAIGTTIDTKISNWSYKENYIKLDSVVKVGKTFFVSFLTDYETYDFALLTTVSDTKTAYFKMDGTWDIWDHHPFNNSVGSLLISAVVREYNSEDDGVRNIIGNGDISIYPNPAKETLQIVATEEIKNIKVYSLGATFIPIYSQKSDSNKRIIDLKDLPKGIYTIETITENNKYHTKFIKE